MSIELIQERLIQNSKNKLYLERETGGWFKLEGTVLSITYLEWFPGNYCEDKPISPDDHYYMASEGQYFPDTEEGMKEALQCFEDRFNSEEPSKCFGKNHYTLEECINLLKKD